MNPQLPQAEVEVASTESLIPSPSLAPVPRTISWLSPTSILNPFFGYPVSAASTHGPPSFRYGRRRKRDLARTLLTLFWIRWRKHISFGACLTVILIIWRLHSPRIRLRFPQRNLGSNWFTSGRGIIQWFATGERAEPTSKLPNKIIIWQVRYHTRVHNIQSQSHEAGCINRQLWVNVVETRQKIDIYLAVNQRKYSGSWMDHGVWFISNDSAKVTMNIPSLLRFERLVGLVHLVRFQVLPRKR